MKRTAKCDLCDFEITKNGHWQTRNAIHNHIRTVHPKEWAKHFEYNKKIRHQITKLRQKIQLLWKFID